MMTSVFNYPAITNPTPYQGKWLPNSAKTRRLPPYGREAELLLSYGVKPKNDIFLFAGVNGWCKAKAFQNTQVVLCLPYGADPANYSWPVRDCPILLFDTGFLSIFDIEKISYCLLNDNAEIVRAILSNEELVIYRRENAI